MSTHLYCRPLYAGLLLASVLAPAPAFAGQKEVQAPVLEEQRKDELYNRIALETSYTWESDFEEGDYEGVDTVYARASYEHTFPVSADGDNGWFVRAGVRYTYLGIGETDAPLPDMLQSISAPISLEYRTDRSQIPLPKFALNLSPGVYFSEEISSNDFDVPSSIFYGFDFSDTLRFYVGATGGIFSKYGVLPVGGAVWRFHKGGMLALSFPQAGLYIFPNKKLELFAGGEWFSHTHRVDREEGFDPELREALLDYREIRVLGSVKYKFCPAASIALSAGYVVDREWDYERADVTLEQEGAPFAKAAVELRF